MSVTPNDMPAVVNDAIVPNVDLEKYRGNNLPLSVGSRCGIAPIAVTMMLAEKNRLLYVWREDAVHVAQR